VRQTVRTVLIASEGAEHVTSAKLVLNVRLTTGAGHTPHQDRETDDRCSIEHDPYIRGSGAHKQRTCSPGGAFCAKPKEFH
jgi:hypothetical protein